MNRLTAWRSFSQKNSPLEKSSGGNLTAYVKRNIKTSTPISNSFGRGYGLGTSKPLGLNLLQTHNEITNLLRREMAVGKPKTKQEMALEEANLNRDNLKIRPAKENLDEIAADLIKLTEKEIQTILDADSNSLQNERGKTWLEQSKFALRDVPEQKDMLMLTKQVGNATVTIKFKKEYEEEREDEEEGEEGGEEGGALTSENGANKEVAEDEPDNAEDWVRSGEELPDRDDFPQKHSMEIDIRIQDKEGKPKGKLHMYGFAGLDDRLYVNEMLCENDVVVDSDEKKTYCIFDDLSDPMQDRIYDYLDELGVDDRMAHFIKTSVAREKKQSDIAFLTNFKEILKN